MVARPTFKTLCECGCGLSLDVDDLTVTNGEPHITLMVQDRRHFFTRKRMELDMVLDEADIWNLHDWLSGVLAGRERP